MSPNEARRLAAVYLLPDHHPHLEVGEAVTDDPDGHRGDGPPVYDVAVTIDGSPGVVRVCGTDACDVALVKLAGTTYPPRRDLVLWQEPAT